MALCQDLGWDCIQGFRESRGRESSVSSPAPRERAHDAPLRFSAAPLQVDAPSRYLPRKQPQSPRQRRSPQHPFPKCNFPSCGEASACRRSCDSQARRRGSGRPSKEVRELAEPFARKACDRRAGECSVNLASSYPWKRTSARHCLQVCMRSIFDASLPVNLLWPGREQLAEDLQLYPKAIGKAMTPHLDPCAWQRYDDLTTPPRTHKQAQRHPSIRRSDACTAR